MASTAASATRCFSPPERVARWRFRYPLSPTEASACVDGASRSPRGAAEVLQAEGDLVLDRERAELSVGILEDQPGLLGEQVHRIVTHDQPGHHHLARVVALHQVRDQTVQAQGERALARPAGAQHQHRLARPDMRRRGRPAPASAGSRR